MNDSNHVEGGTKSKFIKLLLYVCAPIFVLCVLSPVVVTWRSGVGLDNKVTKLEVELSTYRASRIVDRAPLFSPIIEENAVDYYECAEYILTKRSAWKRDVPKLAPELNLWEGFFEGNGPDFETVQFNLTQLLSANARNCPVSDRAPWKSDLVDMEVINAYLPALKYIEQGLRCNRVDWPVDFENGLGMETFQLSGVLFAASLLGHQARTAKGTERITGGIQIVAFGEDCGRAPGLIAKTISVAIKNLGYRSLQETMEQPLSEKEYRRILTFLMSVPVVDPMRTFHEEYLTTACTFAQMGGRSVNGIEAENGIHGTLPFAKKGALSVFVNREWSYLDRLYEKRVKPMCKMSQGELMEKEKELKREIERTWSVFAGVTVRSYAESIRELLKSANESRLLSLLAAAHLHRLKTGGFPAKIDALADYFPNKNLPQATTAKPPSNFDYELKDGQLTVALPGNDDMIYRTWIPK